jgi:hypothetical protein
MTLAPDASSPERRAGRIAALATWLCFLAPCALYAITATRTVQGGDTGEFLVVALRGGVPHPPGYPLYTLLARLFGALPLADPALRVACLSIVCGATAVAVLERALFRLTGSRLASLGAALAFAVTPIQWQLAGVPEVFALNALCTALTLLFAVRLAAPTGRRRDALALGLAFGLGLANHHTIVLVAGLPLWAVLAHGGRVGARGAVPAGLTAAAGLLMGLGLYATLPLLAGGGAAWVWGEPGTPSGLVRHVLRSDYGTLRLGLSSTPPRPVAHVGAFVLGLPRAWLYVHFAAGLLGAALVWRRRGLAIALWASFLLAGVVFLARFNLPDSPVARAVAARFHLLPTLLFAVFVAWGLAAVAARVSAAAARLVVLAAVLLAALSGFGAANWRADRTVERYLVAAVQEAAPDAVILGQGDLELFGFGYVREALRVRPDVRYVDVNLLRLPWYHARLRAGGLELPFDPAVTHLGAVAAAAAARAPTYLTASLLSHARGLAVYPEGLLARVLPDGALPPPPAALEAAATRAARALEPLPGQPVDAWSAGVRVEAAQPLETLAEAFARAGDATRAADCRARAARLTMRAD